MLQPRHRIIGVIELEPNLSLTPAPNHPLRLVYASRLGRHVVEAPVRMSDTPICSSAATGTQTLRADVERLQGDLAEELRGFLQGVT